MKLRPDHARLGVCCILAVWVLTSCATVNNDEETVRAAEIRLEDAGFTRVPVDVPSEDLEHLPTFKLNQYQSTSGIVFWYYDPDYCQCLYEGDQAQADRYQVALQHQNDLAEYKETENEESAAQQALMLSAFNGAVPTPFFWGGWGAWYGYGIGYYGGGGGGHHHGGGGGHQRNPGGGGSHPHGGGPGGGGGGHGLGGHGGGHH